MLGTKLIKAAAGNAAPAGYQIERSLRFNSTDSAYLSWTPAQVGNRKTWTWSGWVKLSQIASGTYYSILDINNGIAGVPRGGLLFYANKLYVAFNPTGSAWVGVYNTSVS